MSHWESRNGTHAPTRCGAAVSSRRLLALVCLPGLVSCDPPILKRIPETIAVAEGAPTVDQSGGTVQTLGAVNPGNFEETNPFQVDTFTQKAVAKIDILWMIDNSGSMAPKQALLQAGFPEFMKPLTSTASVTIDYHIGVVTTDTYNPAQSGKLQNPGGLSSPWISPETCTGSCDPVAAFNVMSNVGTQGTGDEKGLLAASMALTSPLTDPGGPNAGFLRDDASLNIILVSDEEDDSCAPLSTYKEGCNTSPMVDCTSDPTAPYCLPCYDLSNPWCDADLPWGNVGYWTRLFQEIKGYGNESLVNMTAIVGNSQSVTVPQGVGTTQLEGCLVSGADASNPFSYAIYASRYITVATNVSGASGVQSICEPNFAAAESAVALKAALQNTFYLSRQPQSAAKIQVLVDGAVEQAGTTTWSYNQSRNAVIFATVPTAGSTIVISYPVSS